MNLIFASLHGGVTILRATKRSYLQKQCLSGGSQRRASFGCLTSPRLLLTNVAYQTLTQVHITRINCFNATALATRLSTTRWHPSHCKQSVLLSLDLHSDSASRPGVVAHMSRCCARPALLGRKQFMPYSIATTMQTCSCFPHRLFCCI